MNLATRLVEELDRQTATRGRLSPSSVIANSHLLHDRGMVFAVAHVRGGGELGLPWYEHGKLLHKKNTFHRFRLGGTTSHRFWAHQAAEPGGAGRHMPT